jgi:mono/diheme cytochrome c family protein
MKWLKGGEHSRSINPVIGPLAILVLLVLTKTTNILGQEVKQPWKAPESATQMKNPVKPTPEELKATEQLYQQNCVLCHGKTGGSNGPAAGSLPEKPANFTNAKVMQKASDGELFWKISTGRAPMPSWQDRLTEMQRWELVNYLRKLTKEGQYKYLGQST